MSEAAECRHLDGKGICQGKYKGFGCIGDKCLDPTRGPGQKKERADWYCKKHKKFQCEICSVRETGRS